MAFGMEILQKKENNELGIFYLKTTSGNAELWYQINKNTNVMRIYHTFTPNQERGKGLAEKLAEHAFDFAIKNNYLVKPDCDYIKHFVEKHPEFKEYISE